MKPELDKMVKSGMVEEITEPTEWCAPMLLLPRKSGQVRIFVGLNRLNQAVERERYFLQTLDDILPQLSGTTMFLQLDAASRFITLFGRYFFHKETMKVQQRTWMP